MSRIHKCVHCGQPFIGRRDARTCSTRCRKGLQRRRQVLARIDNQKADGRIDLTRQAGAAI